MIVWRPIPRFSRYEVSSCGEVRSRRGHLIRQYPRHNGSPYLRVKLTPDRGKATWCAVHLLVLRVFVGKRPTRKHEGGHKDRDITNNHAENLAWRTRRQNENDKREHGTQPKNRVPKGLPKETVEAIVFRLRAGYPHASIARIFGVHRKTVARIAARCPSEP